ncbi:MAG TPA: pyruvate dehydrogenase (acetyl-transferring), homodimeric type, partial [Roseiarcus sp.]|nr:pyruvate dehydrogenase (acetyl-transferring), homodimeric type [Roseiarcus sp.]
MTTSEAKRPTGAPDADDDPAETAEWLESIDAVVRWRGPERALQLVQKLESWLRDQGVSALQTPYSAYRNTIPLEKQGPYPGDLKLEERLTSIMRWNALAMVVRANRA